MDTNEIQKEYLKRLANKTKRGLKISLTSKTIIKNIPNNPVSIAQYTKEGQFVRSYRSITEAASYIRRNKSTLFQHLNGKYKSCAGYIFKRIY